MDNRLMAEAQQARVAFAATIGLSVLTGIVVIGQAFVLSRLLTRFFLDGATLSDVSAWLWALAGLIALRAIITGGRVYAAAWMTVQIKADLRERFVQHLLALGPAFSKGERSGELALTATEGIQAMDAYYREYLPGMFTAALIPLTIALVVLPVNLFTFGVLAISVPLLFIAMAVVGMSAGKRSNAQFAALSRLSAHFLDVMQGLPTLKLFSRSKDQRMTIKQMTDEFRQTTMSVLRLAFLSSLTLELLATVGIAIVAVQVGFRLLGGTLTYEQALFLLVIAPEFYQPLRQLGKTFHAGRDGTAAAERLFAVLDTPVPDQHGTLAPPETMHIALHDVHVTYGERDALRGVSLTLHSGEVVALVGASGGGKSTVANLLLRFIAPTSGIICVDGVDLQHIDPVAWRERIAWVSQAPYLFNESVAANIRLGKPDASDDDIIAAAKAAQAHDFIIAMEHGYATLVGEQGAKLSGGQAQRIALARAFLRDAPLVILDEATASLDKATEADVHRAMERLLVGRTALIIAHRLNTIVNADRILVMDEGRIVQQGTHRALHAQTGTYRTLVDAYHAHDYDEETAHS